jgi:hypothetical protein
MAELTDAQHRRFHCARAARALCGIALTLACVPLVAPAAGLASAPPVIERETTARLTPTDATLTAKINAGGLETSYQWQMFGFPCSEPAGFGASCELIEVISLPGGTLPASSVGQHISLRLQSAGVTLTPDREYTYNVTATNGLGSAYGPSQSFIAPAPGLPAIYSESVSRVTAHTATIAARINPEGSEARYEIWLWPGCSGGFCERAAPHVVAGGHLAATSQVRVVSIKVTGLPGNVPNNGYWVVATNANGTSEGVHQTFATPSSASG